MDERTAVYCLRTTLTAEACLARMRAAAAQADGLDTWEPTGAERMAVRLSGSRFAVSDIGDGDPPHTFRRRLVGEVIDDGATATVLGSFRLRTGARVGIACWFVSMALMMGALVAAKLAGLAFTGGWVGVVLPAVALLVAAAFVRASLARSRTREAAIARFLTGLVT